MSRAKHLPIYKAGYDLLQLVTQLIKHFSRDYRPTLGQRLHAECVNLVVLVYRANAAQDKAPHLAAMLEALQVVEMLLQLASDLHLISRSQYARTVPLTDGIGRQAGGWAKYARTHGGYPSASSSPGARSRAATSSRVRAARSMPSQTRSGGAPSRTATLGFSVTARGLPSGSDSATKPAGAGT